MDNHQISFNLSQIPKKFRGSRLDNLYFFFDNLTDTNSFSNRDLFEVEFPVKSESLLVLTIVEGKLIFKINLQKQMK